MILAAGEEQQDENPKAFERESFGLFPDDLDHVSERLVNYWTS